MLCEHSDRGGKESKANQDGEADRYSDNDSIPSPKNVRCGVSCRRRNEQEDEPSDDERPAFTSLRGGLFYYHNATGKEYEKSSFDAWMTYWRCFRLPDR